MRYHPSAEAAMFSDDSHEIYSGLSSRKMFGSISVEVRIFRLAFFPEWALEVVTEKDCSFVWDRLFDTEQEALAAFDGPAAELGLAKFLSSPHWEGPHRPRRNIPLACPSPEVEWASSSERGEIESASMYYELG
jgi:hypothetical protein